MVVIRRAGIVGEHIGTICFRFFEGNRGWGRITFLSGEGFHISFHFEYSTGIEVCKTTCLIDMNTTFFLKNGLSDAVL